MSALPGSSISFGKIGAAACDWLKQNLLAAIVSAAIGAGSSFLCNLVLVLWFGRTEAAVFAVRSGNVTGGLLLWTLANMLLFALIAHLRNVGTRQVLKDIPRFPQLLTSLWQTDGPAARTHLLWGAGTTFVVSLFISPALGLVLATLTLIGLPTLFGGLLTALLFQVWSGITALVSPTRRRPLQGSIMIAIGLLGAIAALVLSAIVPYLALKLLLAAGCITAACLLGRGTIPAVACMLVMGLCIALGGQSEHASAQFGFGKKQDGYCVVKIPGTGHGGHGIYSVRMKERLEQGIPYGSFRHGGLGSEPAKYEIIAGPFETVDEATAALGKLIKSGSIHKPPLAAGLIGEIGGQSVTIDDFGDADLGDLRLYSEGKSPPKKPAPPKPLPSTGSSPPLFSLPTARQTYTVQNPSNTSPAKAAMLSLFAGLASALGSGIGSTLGGAASGLASQTGGPWWLPKTTDKNKKPESKQKPVEQKPAEPKAEQKVAQKPAETKAPAKAKEPTPPEDKDPVGTARKKQTLHEIMSILSGMTDTNKRYDLWQQVKAAAGYDAARNPTASQEDLNKLKEAIESAQPWRITSLLKQLMDNQKEQLIFQADIVRGVGGDMADIAKETYDAGKSVLETGKEVMEKPEIIKQKFDEGTKAVKDQIIKGADGLSKVIRTVKDDPLIITDKLAGAAEYVKDSLASAASNTADLVAEVVRDRGRLLFDAAGETIKDVFDAEKVADAFVKGVPGGEALAKASDPNKTTFERLKYGALGGAEWVGAADGLEGLLNLGRAGVAKLAGAGDDVVKAATATTDGAAEGALTRKPPGSTELAERTPANFEPGGKPAVNPSEAAGAHSGSAKMVKLEQNLDAAERALELDTQMDPRKTRDLVDKRDAAREELSRHINQERLTDPRRVNVRAANQTPIDGFANPQRAAVEKELNEVREAIRLDSGVDRARSADLVKRYERLTNASIVHEKQELYGALRQARAKADFHEINRITSDLQELPYDLNRITRPTPPADPTAISTTYRGMNEGRLHSIREQLHSMPEVQGATGGGSRVDRLKDPRGKSDFDVAAIVDTTPDQATLDRYHKISKELSKKIGVEVNIMPVTKERYHMDWQRDDVADLF